MKNTIFALAMLATAPASADTLIVHNDHGGRVDHRLQIIQRIKDAGDRVEIRGDYCNSACTMYLGLPNLCISRKTVLGFHGPKSLSGLMLSPPAFEHWSGVMANHYPPAVASWFMEDARYTPGDKILRVKAAHLIDDHGVSECEQ